MMCCYIPDVKEQFIQEILKVSSFGIQLDESTNMTSETQLMVFCRFSDIETNRIVEHYLFCELFGVRETAETIFQELNEFFENKDWLKRKSVTTDDAAAMQGSQKDVVKRIKQLSPECVGIHCILHREAPCYEET